jgi:frizzled 4
MCMEGPGEPPSNIMPIVSNKPNQPSSCQHFSKSHLYVKLNTNKCMPLCEADIIFDAQEKHLAETWINSWSIAALFLAILATLCLILSNARWDKKLMVGFDEVQIQTLELFESQKLLIQYLYSH